LLPLPSGAVRGAVEDFVVIVIGCCWLLRFGGEASTLFQCGPEHRALASETGHLTSLHWCTACHEFCSAHLWTDSSVYVSVR